MTNVLLHGLWSRWGHGITSWKQPTSSRACAWLDGKKNFIYFISLVFSLSQTKCKAWRAMHCLFLILKWAFAHRPLLLLDLASWKTWRWNRWFVFWVHFVTGLVCWMWCLQKYKPGFRFEWAHKRFLYGGGFFFGSSIWSQSRNNFIGTWRSSCCGQSCNLFRSRSGFDPLCARLSPPRCLTCSWACRMSSGPWGIVVVRVSWPGHPT